MKRILVLVAALTLIVSMGAFAKGEKAKCAKGYTALSCEEFKNKTRDYFCWSSKKISPEKKKSICLKKKTKKKMKKK